MASIKIEKVVYHLGHEFEKALATAVTATVPDAKFNSKSLYSAFEKAIFNECSTWEQVPDDCIQK